jgi:hypothetical protein
MFVLALASLLFGYAVTYYAINAMSHYDSATKTTLAIPFGVTLGLPGGGSGDTAMVFATWGANGSGAQATGAASPASVPAAPDVNKVIQV